MQSNSHHEWWQPNCLLPPPLVTLSIVTAALRSAFGDALWALPYILCMMACVAYMHTHQLSHTLQLNCIHTYKHTHIPLHSTHIVTCMRIHNVHNVMLQVARAAFNCNTHYYMTWYVYDIILWSTLVFQTLPDERFSDSADHFHQWVSEGDHWWMRLQSHHLPNCLKVLETSG